MDTSANPGGLLTDLGTVAFREAHALQHRLVEARHGKSLSRDVVLFLEHPPVFTLGRRGGRGNLIVSESFLRERGISVVPVERGGDITFHGPGQLVVYLVMDLKARKLDIPGFVDILETLMLKTAADFDVEAGRDCRNRGIWVNGRKLGSIGIAIRHGIAFHGIALNVNTDLTPFQWIHPCGLQGVCASSLAFEKNVRQDIADIKLDIADIKLDMADIKNRLRIHLQRVFNAEFTPVLPDILNQYRWPSPKKLDM